MESSDGNFSECIKSLVEVPSQQHIPFICCSRGKAGSYARDTRGSTPLLYRLLTVWPYKDAPKASEVGHIGYPGAVRDAARGLPASFLGDLILPFRNKQRSSTFPCVDGLSFGKACWKRVPELKAPTFNACFTSSHNLPITASVRQPPRTSRVLEQLTDHVFRHDALSILGPIKL